MLQGHISDFFNRCVIVTLVLGAYALSCGAAEKDACLRGRVWAVMEDWFPHTGMSDRFQQFVFGAESKDAQGNTIATPVLINYLIPRSDITLPKVFFDHSNVLELHVHRLPYDKSLESIAQIQYLTADNREDRSPDAIMRLLDGAPANILKMEMMLPYYDLLPGGYGCIDTIDDSSPEAAE